MNGQELEKLAKETLGLDIANMTAEEKANAGKALLKIIESAEALMRPALYFAGFAYDITRTPFLPFFELGMRMAQPEVSNPFVNMGRLYKHTFESTQLEGEEFLRNYAAAHKND